MDANTLLHKIRFAVNTLMRIANDAEAWREFAASDTDTRSVVVDRIEMNMVRFMEQLVNEAHGKESEAE